MGVVDVGELADVALIGIAGLADIVAVFQQIVVVGGVVCQIGSNVHQNLLVDSFVKGPGVLHPETGDDVVIVAGGHHQIEHGASVNERACVNVQMYAGNFLQGGVDLLVVDVDEVCEERGIGDPEAQALPTVGQGQLHRKVHGLRLNGLQVLFRRLLN